MSIQISQQVTRRWAWIPSLSAAASMMLAIGMPQNAAVAAPAAGAPSASSLRAQTDWEDFLLILIELMIHRLSCPSLQLPPDVPVAMMVTADCYYANGLAPMTLSERLEFLALLDEIEDAVNQAPAGFPQDIQKKFLQAIEDMRQAAQAVP